MKLNRYIKYVAIVMLVLSTACSDYLYEENPNVADSGSYWKNLSETNSTLTAAYATLVNSFALNIAMESQRTDLATPGYGRPTYSGDGAVWYNQLYNSSNVYVVKKWEALYSGIFKANQVIEALNRLKNVKDKDDWTLQMAQARFLRGLYHFYLHTSFNKGNIIIKDKVAGNQKSMYQNISKSDDVIKFFRKDLEYAYDNLPIKYSNAKDNGRATKGAAATILGTSYLYEATLKNHDNPDAAKIQKAVDYFDEVANRCGYKLVKDLSLLFTTAGEMNAESIFEVAFSNEINAEYSTWGEDIPSNRLAFYFDGRGNNMSNVFPSCWITMKYLNEQIDPKDPTNTIIDPTDPTKTMKRIVSKRASAMIAVIQDEYTEYYKGYIYEKGKVSFNAKNGFSRYKQYNNHDIVEAEKDLPGGNQHSGKNVTLNRLGDVYMMLAECYIYQNKIDKALEYINKVRSRWGLVLRGTSSDSQHTYDGATYTKASLLDTLKNVEKPLETSIEGYGIRWNDLRRWGMLKSNFEKRSKEVFYGADWTFTSGSLKGKTQNISTLTDVNPNNPNYPVYADYQLAVSNFNYDRDAWLPLPSTEKLTNPDLIK